MPDQSGGRLDVVQSNSELNPATADTREYQPGSGMGAVVIHHLVTAVLVALLLALGIWGYLAYKNADFLSAQTKRPTPFETAAVTAQVDRLHFALGVYQAIYDKYPAQLEALVDEGLLSSSDLAYPPGSSTILYQRIGETYQITVERTVRTTERIEPTGAVAAPESANDSTGEPLGRRTKRSRDRIE